MPVTAQLATPKNSWVRGLINNSTSSAFPTIINTTTDPVSVDSTTPTSNAIVLSAADSNLALSFFGTGADNSTFEAQVWGWSRLLSTDSAQVPLWKPTFLIQVQATLSTSVGVALATQIATERDADTIATSGSVTGLTSGFYNILSPANNVIATLVLDTLGFERVGIYFKTGTATACNAGVRTL